MSSNETGNEVADKFLMNNLEESSSNPQGPLPDAEIQVEEENDEQDPVDIRNKEEKKRKKRKRGNSGETPAQEDIIDEEEESNSKNSCSNLKVPTSKIKLGKRRHGSSDEDGEGKGGKTASIRDSNAEFEQMLQDAEEAIAEKNDSVCQESGKAAPKRKAKTKFGNEKKKKKSKTSSKFPDDDEDGYEVNTTDQGYCEVCQQDVVCLEPELEEAPEGNWSCPHCEEGVVPAKEDDDEHQEFCRVCKDGGELLCCESCPSTYHTFCLNPPLTTIPDGDWKCPRCSANPLPGRVSKILTWRYKPDPNHANDSSKEKSFRQRPREMFVKWHEKSHWDCEWISELQLKVFYPVLLKNYLRKWDTDEPPLIGEPIDDGCLKQVKDDKGNNISLEEKYYRYGVEPEWLMIHRIINHRVLKDGRTTFLVKWRGLRYDQATWEEETKDIPNFKEAITYYWNLRNLMDPSKKYQKMVNEKGSYSNLDNDGEQKSLSSVFDEQSTKIWSTPRHILALQAQLDDLRKRNVNYTEDMVKTQTSKFIVKPSHTEELRVRADNLKKFFKFRYVKEDTVKQPIPKFRIKPSHKEKLRVQADNLKNFKIRYTKEDTVEKPPSYRTEGSSG